MSADLKLRQSQGPVFISIRPVITHKQQHRTMKSKITFWPVRSSPGSKILHFITDILSSEFFLMYLGSFKMRTHTHTHAHICGVSACIVPHMFALKASVLSLLLASVPTVDHFGWFQPFVPPTLVTLPVCHSPIKSTFGIFNPKQQFYTQGVMWNELSDIWSWPVEKLGFLCVWKRHPTFGKF